MGEQPEIHTDRLILRRWTANDLAAFAEMNADPRVMEYFPARLSREESDAIAERIDARFDELGFGLWAVEMPKLVRRPQQTVIRMTEAA
jgi:3-dehydroquinate dehydratase / shikimate dehydrogenase